MKRSVTRHRPHCAKLELAALLVIVIPTPEQSPFLVIPTRERSEAGGICCPSHRHGPHPHSVPPRHHESPWHFLPHKSKKESDCEGGHGYAVAFFAHLRGNDEFVSPGRRH